MKKQHMIPVLLSTALFNVGCVGSSRLIGQEDAIDYDNSHAQIQSIGDRRAEFDVQHWKRKMYLYIYSAAENPDPISNKSLDATLTLPNGTKKKLTFKADPRFSKSKNSPITNRYFFKQSWVETTRDFTIKFSIPIKNKVYSAGYIYKNPSPWGPSRYSLKLQPERFI